MNKYNSISKSLQSFIDSQEYSEFTSLLDGEFLNVYDFLNRKLSEVNLSDKNLVSTLEKEQIKVSGMYDVLEYIKALPKKIDQSRAKELQKRL